MVKTRVADRQFRDVLISQRFVAEIKKTGDPKIEIYLANDLPLIVKYNVASLGEIKLCLASLPPS